MYMKTHCDNHAEYDRTCVSCISLRAKADREEANTAKMVSDTLSNPSVSDDVVKEDFSTFSNLPTEVPPDFSSGGGDFGGGGSSSEY